MSLLVRRSIHAFSWTILAAAVAVGVYAAGFASRPPCVALCQPLTTARTLSWISAAVALGLLASLSVLAIHHHRDLTPPRGLARALRWGAGLAAVALAVAVVRTRLLQNAGSGPLQLAVPTTQLPLAATAVGLTIVGSLAALVGVARTPSPRPARARAAAVLGAVTAVAVAAGALGASAATIRYQRAQIDATTAAPAAVPAPPEAVGQKSFRVRTGPQPLANQTPAQTVIPAGTGFVTITEDGHAVTAYDSTGTPRWHYRRTGELRISRVHGYANGTTLIASLRNAARSYRDPEDAAVLALDANTGTLLWTSTDQTLVTAATRYKDSPFLAYRQGPRWTGIDPRTGEARWSIANPLPCTDDHPLFADTSERIAALFACDRDGRDWRVISLDPTTGAVAGIVALSYPTGATKLDTISIHPASSQGVVVTLDATTDTGHRVDVNRYINMTTLTVKDFEGLHQFLAHAATASPHGDPVLSSRDGTALLNADGTVRCTFPAGQGPLDTNSILFLQYDSLAWTPQTIAYLSFTDHHYVVHTARRSDCTPTSSADLNVNWTFGVLALPGTFAVFADERDAGSPNVTDGANYLIGLH